METKYAEIFTDAWNTVVESYSPGYIVSEYTEAPAGRVKGRDICVLIGIIGNLNGQVFLSMDAETGKVLASEMLGGMEITEVDELVISAVSELCNMIMGNACSNISSGEPVDITPPTVISDEEERLNAKPLYNISFLLENSKIVDFHLDVMSA